MSIKWNTKQDTRNKPFLPLQLVLQQFRYFNPSEPTQCIKAFLVLSWSSIQCLNITRRLDIILLLLLCFQLFINTQYSNFEISDTLKFIACFAIDLCTIVSIIPDHDF